VDNLHPEKWRESSMKSLVVFDSVFGNTRQIAEAIGSALGSQGEVETLQVGDVKPQQLADLSLLIVGSPTRQFSPTGATTSFLKNILKNGLKGVAVAAFDTRFAESEIERVRILAFFVRIFGYAAEPNAKRLERKGGELVVPPEGFFVTDVEGPLQEGELERAEEWAKQILASLS
jgi:flavodoxin